VLAARHEWLCLRCPSYSYDGLRLVPIQRSDPNHYKFTGKERDTESNLDYFGARFYGSKTGRFMTPDWAAKPTSVPYANFGNPQSLNLYSYVQNNPTTVGDPDGHCPWCPVVEEVLESPEGQAAVDWGAHLLAGAGALLTAAAAALENGPGTDVIPGLDPGPGLAAQQLREAQSANAQQAQSAQPAQASQSSQSTPAQPPDGTSGLPKLPTGKGSVPPEQRDPKRVWTKAENKRKLDQQGGKCANCGKDTTIDESRGHHTKRHADGTPTDDQHHAVVCIGCHKELHQPPGPQ
jgi:RHS repeat-associated protein